MRLIGVDVGGTFTDMVLRDAEGAVRIFKSPSVPADPSVYLPGAALAAAKRQTAGLNLGRGAGHIAGSGRAQPGEKLNRPSSP